MTGQLKRAWENLRRRISIHASYVRVFETPDGQEVLQHICKEAHVFDTTFVAGDPYQTALREGQRMTALSILKFIGKDHSKMIEQIERNIQDEQE